MRDKVQGEGDYEAARRYDRKVSDHARDAEKVEAEARAARRALEGAEHDALEAAEKAGKARIRR